MADVNHSRNLPGIPDTSASVLECSCGPMKSPCMWAFGGEVTNLGDAGEKRLLIESENKRERKEEIKASSRGK